MCVSGPAYQVIDNGLKLIEKHAGCHRWVFRQRHSKLFYALILVSLAVLTAHSKFPLKTRNQVWKVKPKEEWLKFCCCQSSSILFILFCGFWWDMLCQSRAWGMFKERGRAPPYVWKHKIPFIACTWVPENCGSPVSSNEIHCELQLHMHTIPMKVIYTSKPCSACVYPSLNTHIHKQMLHCMAASSPAAPLTVRDHTHTHTPPDYWSAPPILTHTHRYLLTVCTLLYTHILYILAFLSWYLHKYIHLSKTFLLNLLAGFHFK